LTELIVRNEGAIDKGSAMESVCAGVEESETVKVTEVVPLEIGSPEMTPLLPRVRPTGNALDDQAYGAVPPLTCSEPEYIEPTAPAGSEGVICNSVGAIGGGGVETGGGTVKPNCIAVVCAGEPESVTVIVNEKTPFEVGAPEITPVVEDRLSPEGNCPPVIVQLYAGVPPLAINAAL
jgi:hypothetical protein